MTNSRIIEAALKSAETPTLLETSEQLREAEKQWSGKERLGIDTEFLRERTYRAALGLVQISDGVKTWLVDPIRIKDLDPLVRLFCNPHVMKVFHSASEDLEVLWHSLGVAPEPLVDTQIACAMIGHSLQLGYHHAVKDLFGFEVDKGQTRSNWMQRPLTEAQLHYAAVDVVFLPAMLDKLRTDLKKNNRWAWLEEDVASMIQNSQTVTDPATAYLRINGINRLNTHGLRIARALAEWREKTAQEKNLARGFVIRDQVILQIATAKPESVEELIKIEGLHPKEANRYGGLLLQFVEQSGTSALDVEQLEPLDGKHRKVLDAMRHIVKIEAERLKVDPALLASRKILETLLRQAENTDTVPERFYGWRKSIITDQLLGLVTTSASS